MSEIEEARIASINLNMAVNLPNVCKSFELERRQAAMLMIICFGPPKSVGLPILGQSVEMVVRPKTD